MKAKRVLLIVVALFLSLLSLSLFLQAGVQALRAGGFFNDGGQALGSDTTYDVALADSDRDGDLDALVANQLGNRLWLNDGFGCFDNSEQIPGSADSRGVAIADLNGDTYLDAFIANQGTDNEVWLNDSAGQFTQLPQMMNPTAVSRDVALADLNGDEITDAVVANEDLNEVWLNDGTAVFSLTQTLTRSETSLEVALGDVDGDLDIDIYFANGNAGAIADELWFNDGNGGFTSTQQTLDFGWNEGVALGDLDGDDDLDLFLADWSGNDRVWLNQGGDQGGTPGIFSDTLQALSGPGSTDVTFIDVNDDMALDAIVAKWLQPNEIWLNDGNGNFSLSGETLDDAATFEVAGGNIDGDNRPDLFFGNFGANTAWLTSGRCQIVIFNLNTRENSAGQHQYPHVQSAPAELPLLLRFSPTTTVNVLANIAGDAGVTTETVIINAGFFEGQLDVSNPAPAVSESLTITLQIAGEAPQEDVVPPLSLTFINEGEGDQDCLLCYVDWLLKLMGFQTAFWELHHLILFDIRDTASWDYYQGLFSNNTAEMVTIMATDPGLLWDTYDTLDTWTPAVRSIDEGTSDMVIVTAPMADDARAVLEDIQDSASPTLAAQIQAEIDYLDFDTMPGMTMDEVVERVVARVGERLYLPLVQRTP